MLATRTSDLLQDTPPLPHLCDPADRACAPRARLELVKLEKQVGFVGVVVPRLHLRPEAGGKSHGCKFRQ